MYSCAGLQSVGVLHAVNYISCTIDGHEDGAYHLNAHRNKATGGDGDVYETSS